MDHEIDKQKPSSKEGGQVQVGDTVWVKCRVKNVRSDGFVEVVHGAGIFRALSVDCRPEAEMLDAKELTSKHNKGIEVQGE
jgi:hypothetical protein